jgi:hypothetical protein
MDDFKNGRLQKKSLMVAYRLGRVGSEGEKKTSKNMIPTRYQWPFFVHPFLLTMLFFKIKKPLHRETSLLQKYAAGANARRAICSGAVRLSDWELKWEKTTDWVFARETIQSISTARNLCRQELGTILQGIGTGQW